MSQRFKINPFTGKLDITDEDLAPPGDVEYLIGDTGGNVGPNAGRAINIVGGTGIDVDGNSGTNTLTITSTSSGIVWTREANIAVLLEIDHGYILTNAGTTQCTLPLTANFGETITIIGEGLGGWLIGQNAGQSIQFGNLSTTVGVGGSLRSTNQYDTVKITCRVDNTTWAVEYATGVLNVV